LFRLGYVPLWEDDPAYIKEKEREVTAGFAPCQCSNCLSAESAKLLKHLVLANQDNFDTILNDSFDPPSIPDISHKYPSKQPAPQKRKFLDLEMVPLNEFKFQLISSMEDMYNRVVPSGGPLAACDLFDIIEADAIILNLHNISSTDNI
jgi:hypothetical protein